jgi:hypothetical protein
MTREQRIRHTLARADFLSTRSGLVATEDLRRFMPAPAAPVTLPPMPYSQEVIQ